MIHCSKTEEKYFNLPPWWGWPGSAHMWPALLCQERERKRVRKGLDSEKHTGGICPCSLTPPTRTNYPSETLSPICFLCSITGCVDPLLFSGFLPSQDEPVGLICFGLESLIPIMSTCILYKQLGEVGGVLGQTSPCQIYLHSTSNTHKKKKKKFPESLLLCHRFNRKQVADHKATLQTQAVNFSETTTIRTHNHTHCGSHMLSNTHSHTLSAALSLSKFLTLPHTLIYTSSLNSRPLPLLWMLPCSVDDLSHSLPPSIHCFNCFSRSLSTSPTPALTTSTKLTPQARSVESVGGVRCWHFPPPLHWAQLQVWTACLLSLSLQCASGQTSLLLES